MEDLSTALRRLAGTATAPGVADPAVLWKQGRTRVRRRRATAVLTTAVVAVAGYLVLQRPEPTIVMPAGEIHARAIPKNIYSPSRFLAGVSEEGPPGQLAVIAQKPGDEDHSGSWFGISAATGEYRYLDLPREGSDSEMALSPDGRRVAYWVTGTTRKSTFGKGDGLNVGGPLPDRPITGVAIYNATTGRVVEHQVLSDFGLLPNDGPQGGLAWLSDDTLVFTYGVRAGSNSTRDFASYRWSPVGSTPVELKKGESRAYFAPSLPGEGWITASDQVEDTLGAVFVDALGNPTGRTFFTTDSMGTNGDGRLTVNDGRVVGIGASLIDKTQSDETTTASLGVPSLSIGELPANGGSLRLRPVGSVVDPQFVGWLSTERVLVTGKPGEKRDADYFAPGEAPGEGALYVQYGEDGEQVEGAWLYDVNVVTGKTQRLGVVDSDVSSVVVAADLLSEPMVHGDEPPSVLQAFRVPLGVGALLLAGIGAAWFWRRRGGGAQHARERGTDV